MDSGSEERKREREMQDDRKRTVWVTLSVLKEGVETEEMLKPQVGGAICVDPSGILLTTVITCPFVYKKGWFSFTNPYDFKVSAMNTFGKDFPLKLLRSWPRYGLLLYKIKEKQNNFDYFDLSEINDLGIMSGERVYSYIHEAGIEAPYSFVIGLSNFRLPVVDYDEFDNMPTFDKMSSHDSSDYFRPYRLLGAVVDVESFDTGFLSYNPQECRTMCPQLPVLQMDKFGFDNGTYMGQSGCPIFRSKNHELLGLLFFSKVNFRFALPIGIAKHCWTEYMNESSKPMKKSKDGKRGESSSKGGKRGKRGKGRRDRKSERGESSSKGGRSLSKTVSRAGAVNSASGSAFADFGNTKVIISVFEPRESKKAMIYSDTGRLNCDVSYTTFATPTCGQGSDCKEISSMLHKVREGAKILDTFPKTTVDVFALVSESGGSDLPVVINCASLALADAGIMLYDLIASVSVSCLGKSLVIDPILEEESYQEGSLMISCMPSRNEVTQLTITGEWSTPKVHEAMELCLDACSKLGEIMRSRLKESASASHE